MPMLVPMLVMHATEATVGATFDNKGALSGGVRGHLVFLKPQQTTNTRHAAMTTDDIRHVFLQEHDGAEWSLLCWGLTPILSLMRKEYETKQTRRS